LAARFAPAEDPGFATRPAATRLSLASAASVSRPAALLRLHRSRGVVRLVREIARAHRDDRTRRGNAREEERRTSERASDVREEERAR
jgi:hypothetical protein